MSDTEIDLFLEEMKTRPAAKRSEYNLAHILVRVPEQASPERVEAARASAAKALAEARAGADFARLAAAYSDAPDALRAAQSAGARTSACPSSSSSALAKLKPGEVSELLRSPAGFHVLKLVERRGVAAATRRSRRRACATSWSAPARWCPRARRGGACSDLRERIVGGGADFAELARVHSDDDTAARGGELDWVYPGDTVPEFERAIPGAQGRAR